MHITIKPPKITVSMLASEFPWDIMPPMGGLHETRNIMR